MVVKTETEIAYVSVISLHQRW